ncbi:mechanosensitive ion channel family protein [Halococcus qingdaonensis]|uniref:mechanosensitive ion channel family protein n=1 Tax=Halococcus qingdaonensis TaxID=224402 RepID=UPI0021166EDD|nr:mechanosensitive ion channel family protein [Halococcus qingdaonensis]
MLVPEFLRSIQKAYLSSTGGQLLGSLGALVVLAGIVMLVRRAGKPLKRRYSSRLTEALQAGVVAVCVVGTVYWLMVVWRVVPAIGLVLDALSVNRWTGARLLLIAGVIVLAYLLIRLLNRSIDRLAEEYGAITDHQSEVAYHIADVGVAVAALFVVLAIWGIELSRLFLSAGALGAVIGLAARETIGSITAGFVLLFSRPFHVGDWIAVGEYEGIVREVTIVNTEIRTFNDEHVLIPNDQITSEPLVNLSENNRLRVDTEIGIDYATDLDDVVALTEETMAEMDEPRSVPSPQAVLKEFDESSIVLEARFWIDDPSSRRVWGAKSAFIQAIKRAFDHEGISIAYPQRVLAARDEVGEVGPHAEHGSLSTATDWGE